MEKFLIEVSHEGDKASCMHAIQIFLASGSHFVTNAEWGCTDGDHKAWMIVETDNKAEAMRIIPPGYRPDTKITKLHKFTKEELKGPVMDHHS